MSVEWPYYTYAHTATFRWAFGQNKCTASVSDYRQSCERRLGGDGLR